ncbi:MAG: tyrosine-type recombinase/integrase [Candidatus Azobacteroides sp.]|nr:tyrosine-type recombinase/integrase [Candidatus Azobacteroides sp.]
MSIESFLQYMQYEKNYSSHTVTAYEKDLAQFVFFLQNTYQISDWNEVQSDIIRSWIVSLLKEKNTPRTVNRKLSAVKSFFNFLMKEGEVKTNPARSVSGPKVNKKLPVFVKEKEMDMLLDHVFVVKDFETCRDRLIVEFFYLTGIRRAELIDLKSVDVDLSASQIKVTGKRNKQRIIPFGDELKDHIREYLEFKEREVSVSDDFFFVRKSGEKMYPKQVYLIVKEYLTTVSSLEKRSPHVLRHTFATVMLNHQAGLNHVKEILGHSSLAATEIYTHITFEELKKVYHEAHPREG